jgi:hypothetical protein
MREPILAVLPEGHPLGSLERIPMARLRPEPLILFPREQAPGLHDAIAPVVRAFVEIARRVTARTPPAPRRPR